jgi:hypothetical protein
MITAVTVWGKMENFLSRIPGGTVAGGCGRGALLLGMVKLYLVVLIKMLCTPWEVFKLKISRRYGVRIRTVNFEIPFLPTEVKLTSVKIAPRDPRFGYNYD